MSYAGDITPEEAWKLLNDNPEAVLVDCRTDAEWRFVGVAGSGFAAARRGVRRVEPTDGKHNDNFVEDLKAAGVTPGERPVAAGLAETIADASSHESQQQIDHHYRPEG